MDRLKQAVRDMAFQLFNEGASIPGHREQGYELHSITANSVIVRVGADPKVPHSAPRYFEIKITEKL